MPRFVIETLGVGVDIAFCLPLGKDRESINQYI